MFFLKELPSRETLERYHERFAQMQLDVVAEALQLMKKGSLLIRRIDEYFAKRFFSQLRYLTLVVIEREPDRDMMIVTELAANLDVFKPVMPRTLKALVDDGFIRIFRDEKDRRVRLVMLTQTGRDMLESVLPGYYETIQNVMPQLENDPS